MEWRKISKFYPQANSVDVYRIALWKQNYGGSFIFNNEADKGQIIEVLMQLSPIAIEDQVRNVCKAIQSDINSIPPIYREWPPNENNLCTKKTEVPPLLNLLSVFMLTSGKRVGNQKKSRLNSICNQRKT